MKPIIHKCKLVITSKQKNRNQLRLDEKCVKGEQSTIVIADMLGVLLSVRNTGRDEMAVSGSPGLMK